MGSNFENSQKNSIKRRLPMSLGSVYSFSETETYDEIYRLSKFGPTTFLNEAVWEFL